MSQKEVAKQDRVSRRSFLGGAAAIGAGTFVAPAFGAAKEANDTIKVGFIGLGRRGTELIKETLKLGKVKVAALCDIYDIRLKEAAKTAKLGSEGIYRDYRKLLEDSEVDAVVVATPNHWHAKMTMDALEAKKDVYCETPFTWQWDQKEEEPANKVKGYLEARKIAEKAEKDQRIVQVGVTECSKSMWQEGFEFIDEGKLGKVLLTTASSSKNAKTDPWNFKIDKRADPNKNVNWKAFLGPAPSTSWEAERFFRWRNFWAYSGGIPPNLFFPKLAPLLMTLDGVEYAECPRRVTAFGGKYQFWNREVPDTQTVQIDYPALHTVVLVSTLANNVGIPDTIRGHEGTIFINEDRLEVKPQKQVVGKASSTTIKNKTPGTAASHLKNFFSSMRSRKDPSCPAFLAYKIQIATDMMVLSFREGKTTYWQRRKEQILLP